jgi:CheY-like chemotaxis protein
MSLPKLLIVDDEQDLVEMLAMRLKATGLFEIETACDGVKALQQIEKNMPDVVLLDNVMPNMDGWEVCQRLRAAHPKVAIVMMTAGTPMRSQQKAHDLCADGLVLKPYDQAEVIETLKRVATTSLSQEA